ncbi:MAG: MFS transporter [Actinomycetota bacterium]
MVAPTLGEGRGRHRQDSRLNSRFTALFWGQAISQFGDYIAYLTVPLFVFQLTGRELDLAISYSLETVPGLAFGLVGGVLLDRVPLRSAMIVADLARAAAFVALAVLSLDQGSSTLTMVFLMAFLIGTFSSVFQNGLASVLPEIVAHEDLSLANGRIAASQHIALVTGPLVAGVMAATVGVAPGFFINAATFVVSALSVWLIGPVPARIRVDERGSLFEEAVHGLRYLWNEPRLRASTIAAASVNAAVGFVESTLVYLGATELGAGPNGLGTIFMSFGLGGVLGAVIAPRVIRLLGLGRVMTTGMLIFGLSLLAVVRTRYGVGALLLFFIMFVGISLVNVPLATIRQIYTPHAMLGRVITAARTIGWSTLPIGAMLGALVAESTNYSTVARATPLILIVTGVSLFFTSIWRDTFGPSNGRRLTNS